MQAMMIDQPVIVFLPLVPRAFISNNELLLYQSMYEIDSNLHLSLLMKIFTRHIAPFDRLLNQ